MTSQPEGGPTAPAETPTCYRHPDRETWVRCSRCERPICPDCMVVASVGFQCPECVREGAKTVRQARTVAGGAVVTTPWVTYVLIAANVVVFALQQADKRLTDTLAMLSVTVGTQSPDGSERVLRGVAGGDWYRLVTNAFVHANVVHILVNMVGLYVLGTQLEPVLGRLRFGLLYGVSLLGASSVVYLLSAPNALTVGASGAIFGLFGGLLVVARRFRLPVNQLIGVLAVNLVINLAFNGLSWQGHLGGFVTGLVLSAGLLFPPKPAARLALVAVPVALLALFVLLDVVRTGALHSAGLQ